MICIHDLRFLLKIFQSNANFLKESHISRAFEPQAFDHGPGPGPVLSPSPNVRPRALQKTQGSGPGPGWAWAGLGP